MTQMQTFRSRLGRLKHRRALTRWQTAIARGIVLDVLALFALLLIDFSFRLEAIPRLIVILLIVGAVLRRALRHILPDLTCHETVVDVALLLERRHGVDSDLVAALQFEGPANSSNGSPDLRRAVIDRAVQLSESIDMKSAVPRDDARRASIVATAALISVAALCLALPDHASAFWNRVCLGNAAYPTRTKIQEISINGESNRANVVEGESVAFTVKCYGVLPINGTVEMNGVETGDSTSIVLKRIDGSAEVAVYAADGPVLNEPVDYSIRIGDARTDFRRIELVRRPLVELTIEAMAPDYTQRKTVRQHEHYIQVMEGSAIELSVRCTNDKRLAEVQFETITDNDDSERSTPRKFSVADESGYEWRLDAAASELMRVTNDLQFRVSVVDEDGLATYHPVEGAIRVKRDRGPVATIASQHHVIMPNAMPTVRYMVEDDFGIGKLALRVRRSGSRDTIPIIPPTQEGTDSVAFPHDFQDVSTFDLLLPDSRGSQDEKTLNGVYAIDVRPFDLVKGDKLLVWIEVTDYRGRWPGVSAVSEWIELEVSDERGVVDAILRSDADAEQMLTDAIEKELGLKGDR